MMIHAVILWLIDLNIFFSRHLLYNYLNNVNKLVFSQNMALVHNWNPQIGSLFILLCNFCPFSSTFKSLLLVSIGGWQPDSWCYSTSSGYGQWRPRASSRPQSALHCLWHWKAQYCYNHQKDDPDERWRGDSLHWPRSQLRLWSIGGCGVGYAYDNLRKY